MQALEAQIREEQESLKRSTACTPGSATKPSPSCAPPAGKRIKQNHGADSDDSADDLELTKSLLQAFQASASPGPLQSDGYELIECDSPAKPLTALHSPLKPQTLNFESQSTYTPSPAGDTLVISSPNPSSVESVT